jgi:hypothetical protein
MRNIGFGTLLLITFLTGTAPAKNPGSGIDFAAESFWQNHSIGVGRVVQTDGILARFTTVSTISGAISPGERLGMVVHEFLSLQEIEKTSGVVRISFWDNDGNPLLRKGDCLLLVEALSRNEFVQAKRIKGVDDPLVKGLTRIAELRSGSDPAALAQAVLLPEPVVADYALRRLIENPSLRKGLDAQSRPEYSRQLLELRNDRKREPGTRLSLHALASLLDTNLPAEAEYVWLQQALTRDTREDSDLFLNKLLEHKEKREDTAAFLIGIAKNSGTPAPFRSTVSSYLSDRRVYDYSNPSGPLSKRVFETCLELLRDSSRQLRSGGSGALNVIVRDTKDPAEKQRLSAAATAAIRQALQKEKDEETQSIFENDLLDLSGEFYPPEILRRFPDLPRPRP